MFSGLTGQNDKVRMFFANKETSIDTDANRVYDDPNMPEKIKFLIDKDGRVMMYGALVKGGTKLTDVTVDGNSILNDVRMNNVKILGNSELRDAQFFGLIRTVIFEINDSNFDDLFKWNGTQYEMSVMNFLMQRSEIRIKAARGNMIVKLPYREGKGVYVGSDPIMFVGCMVRIINTSGYNITVTGSVTISGTNTSDAIISNGYELYAQCELTSVSSSRRIWWRRNYLGLRISDGVYVPPVQGLFPTI